LPQLTSGLPSDLETIHLMGICGTAMGSLAGMLVDAGLQVTGSDTGIYPPMSDYLAGLGIEPMEGFVGSNLDHNPDVVVVGNVIRKVYDEAQTLLERDLPYTSMPQLLGDLFLSKQHSIVVAGTHGKTTTTAITAWLLESAGKAPGFLIGGVVANFDRTARSGAGNVFVIEGDEYDTAFFDKRPKFVHYHPNTAILTSVEFDHADIYDDLDHVKRSFRTLVASMPSDGTLVARWDDPNVRDVCSEAGCTIEPYGPDQKWDGRIVDVDTVRGVMRFEVLKDGEPLGPFESALVGEHNLYNQVAATVAALGQGLTVAQLQEGFRTFRGIKRRQEVRGEPGEVTVIDDFAHHPTAVQVTVDALRTRFGSRRLWVIWEPRSATSRRSIFQDAYAQAFDKVDRVIVAPPYDTSRIAEGERFDSLALVTALGDRGVDATVMRDVDQIAATVAAQAHPRDVVAVFSNGAFGGIHQKLLDRLGDRFGA